MRRNKEHTTDMMKKRTRAVLSLCLAFAGVAGVQAAESAADSTEKVNYMPEIHGTVRAKYEYQPEISSGRFEVRNARFSLTGNVARSVSYKAEIDLSDEGQIKMLDAYARFSPWSKKAVSRNGKLSVEGANFTIGQMRVPFTIDAHRSPHQQYFANRSFIAKQVGNVRDVGATVGARFDVGFPIVLEAGLFNGSGLTEQKDFWTDQVNYSAKAQLLFAPGWNLTLSTQHIRPDSIGIYMYDAGLYFERAGWHVEAEYLLKHYSQDAYGDVHAVDAFVSYTLPLRKVFHSMSFLGRYDYMSDHSDGTREDGILVTNDYRRQRLTGGITLSIRKPFLSDIRLNYEKYFYREGAIPKVSEQDKVVVEFMVRF